MDEQVDVTLPSCRRPCKGCGLREIKKAHSNNRRKTGQRYSAVVHSRS